MHATQSPLTIAAVDLGSNSFHLVIARVVAQELQILDRMREPVCLAAGLDADHHLTEQAQSAALDCLERIGQRLRNLPEDHVRIVGTNTLRKARNARAFLGRAQKTLGHPIEVISGQEEARLIYLGVAHSHFSEASQLVVDIGGGSTEIIVGEEFEVLRGHSLYMGCVAYTRRFFPGGAIRKEFFRDAELAARLELRAIQSGLRDMGWSTCIGSSGTVNAIQDLLVAIGGSNGGITLEGLKKLRKEMLAAGSIDRLALPTLKPDRAQVLPGGLAILMAVFRSLGIETLSASPGALREGVLHDLVGRIRHEDVRDSTIRRLVQQYHVDVTQFARVERAALQLLRQIGLPGNIDSPVSRKFLSWASRLHEIGLALSHTGFHKHGAYLVTYSDMPGFSADDQRLLAALIRGHRRKLSRSIFAALSAGSEELALHLCVILRLAVLLNRSRAMEAIPLAAVSADWSVLTLTFPPGWMKDHPLTVADLEEEATGLRAVGIALVVHEAPSFPPRTALSTNSARAK